MNDKNSDLVEFENVQIQYETDSALLCLIDEQKIWVPKSLIPEENEELETNTLKTFTISLPQWFAEQKNLV